MAEDRAADWDYWRQIPKAAIWEETALSRNIDPRKVRKEWDREGDYDSLTFPDEDPEFRARLEIASRNLGNGLDAKIASDPVQSVATLAGFAKWAASHPRRWTLPDPFRELAAVAPDTQEPKGKDRKTLLQLILGMAIDSYHYDPKSQRSKVPGEIAADLQKHGLSLTDDTVRRWLKIACDELDWQPPPP